MKKDQEKFEDLESQIADLHKQNKELRSLFSLTDSINNYKLSKIGNNTGIATTDNQYLTVLNKISDALFVKEEKGRFVLVNNEFCRFINLTREEIVGKTLGDVIHPALKDHFQKAEAEVLLNCFEHISEVTFTLHGGQLKTILTKISQFSDSQGRKYLVGVIHDITNHKKIEEALQMSEAQFRSLFTRSHIASAQVGLDKKFKRCNRAFCQFLGYNEEEIIGKTIADFTHPDDVVIGMEDMKKIVEGKLSSTMVHKRYVRKDGEIVWGELTISIVRDECQKPLYFLPVIQDITSRNKALIALKENELQLKKLISTKDKLFSIIAHDLRSPFNSIINFSELLLEKKEELNSSEIDQVINYIHGAAKNAFSLLDNLLNWAKAQTGQLQFEPKVVDISVLLQQVMEVSKANAASKHIKFICENKGFNKVMADENMLKMILLNLITNAIKFSYQYGEIRITTISSDSEFKVIVSDDGVGMNGSQLTSLFNENNYSTSLGTENEKGSGLGLILCKEFIEKHGGTIQAKSKEGTGSDFMIKLPVKN